MFREHLRRAFFALSGLLIAAIVGADTIVLYEPPPHLMKDGYMSNIYHQTGVNGPELVVGGWGDTYWSLFRFDLEGLPRNADEVYIQLYAKDSLGSATPVEMGVWMLTSPWSEPPSWGTSLYGYNLGNVPPPTENSWYTLRIDSVYDAWKNDGVPNEGLLFLPVANDNRFNRFISSDVPYQQRQDRPRLWVFYTPTVSVPAFKSPLPGGESWLLTTEVGGTSCATSGVLGTHTGQNYFALDFVPVTSNGSDPSVPIFASAGGRVLFAGWNSSKPCNGYHVIIDHDGDGSASTGYQSYYLHLRQPPLVGTGSTVIQGQQLGILGNSGTNQGCGAWNDHIHFQVKYRNNGSPATDELSFVQVEGRELKEYFTDCTSSGTRVRYFPSTNTSQ